MNPRGIYESPYVIEDNARAFREAISRGWSPMLMTAERFGVRPSVATRMNQEVRRRGLIADVDWIAGMALEGHSPRSVGWDDSPGRWQACRTCRSPWPCEVADVEVLARRVDT